MGNQEQSNLADGLDDDVVHAVGVSPVSRAFIDGLQSRIGTRGARRFLEEVAAQGLTVDQAVSRIHANWTNQSAPLSKNA